MNKKRTGLMIVVAMVFSLMLILPAFSAERVVDLPITQVSTQLDRNGAEYTRLIVNEAKQIQGVSYTVGVPAMAFGETNAVAKDLQVGDSLKAIVSDRSFNGRSSLTIIKFIE